MFCTHNKVRAKANEFHLAQNKLYLDLRERPIKMAVH